MRQAIAQIMAEVTRNVLRNHATYIGDTTSIDEPTYGVGIFRARQHSYCSTSAGGRPAVPHAA
ncbi:MAG TPA: hypothetical protein VGK31_08450, partial [Thermoanaerobaculia bacterium]